MEPAGVGGNAERDAGQRSHGGEEFEVVEANVAHLKPAVAARQGQVVERAEDVRENRSAAKLLLVYGPFHDAGEDAGRYKSACSTFCANNYAEAAGTNYTQETRKSP